jgi:hypothetical protein
MKREHMMTDHSFFEITAGELSLITLSRESAREAVRRIEALDEYGSIPFILKRAHSSSEELVEGLLQAHNRQVLSVLQNNGRA